MTSASLRSVFILLLLACTCVFADEIKKAPYAEQLQAAEIEPTGQGISAYLERIKPSDDKQAAIADYIRQLGADSFKARRDAERVLKEFGMAAESALKTVKNSADPEVRDRARQILATITSTDREQLMFMVLESATEVGDVNPLAIVNIMPLCGKDYLYRSANKALGSNVGEDDKTMLVKSLDHSHHLVRAAAVHSLGTLSDVDSDLLVEACKSERHDQVLIEYAKVLANSGNWQAIDVLMGLLESRTPNTRSTAAVMLKRFTGQKINFPAYGSTESRQAAFKEWQTWVLANKTTAKLTYPLTTLGVASYLNGNSLIAYGYNNKVEELDPAGKVINRLDVQGAWSAEKLGDGNILVAAYNENRAVIMTPKGDVVWEYSCNALNAKALENGNILVADHRGRKALEISRKTQKVVWSYEAQESTADLERLPNGNTLVAYGKSLVEITPTLEEVWRYDANGQVYGVDALDNGNILIGLISPGSAIEITRAKKVVWEYPAENVCDVYRLPDGNTLITTNNEFLIVSPDKRIIKSLDGANYGSYRK